MGRHTLERVRRLLAVGVVACGAIVGAAATGATSAATDTTATGSELDPGATLRVGYATLIPSLDPLASPSDVPPFRVLELVYDRLFTIGPDGVLGPKVVQDWSYSDDGLALTLNLREDVTFRDGAPLDAEVVKLNLDRVKDGDGPALPGRLSAIESVEVVDPYTVRVNLKAPTPDIPYVLAETAGFMMHPDLITNGDPESETNGSGPYVVEEFVPGESLTLVRDNDHYWDPDAAKVARVEFRQYTDFTAISAAMQGGQLDLAQFDPSSVGDLADADGFNVDRFAHGQGVDLYFNTDFAPLDDVLVRQAINFAINRPDLMGAFYAESEVKWQDRREGQPGFNPDLQERYPYDPDQARELLAEAGHESLDLGEVLISASLAPGTGDAVQAMLADVGISIELVTVQQLEIFGLWSAGENSMQLNPAGSGTAYTSGMAYRWMRPVAQPDGVPDEFTPLFAAASDTTLPDAEREAAEFALSEFVVENALSAPITWITYPWVSRDVVVGHTSDVADYGNTIGPYALEYTGILGG